MSSPLVIECGRLCIATAESYRLSTPLSATNAGDAGGIGKGRKVEDAGERDDDDVVVVVDDVGTGRDHGNGVGGNGSEGWVEDDRYR